MERVRQEDKEEVAIFLKKYNKINSKFIKTKFISNNLRFSSYPSVEEKDFHVEKIYILLEDKSFRKILECELKLSDLILFSKKYYFSIKYKEKLDSGLVYSGTESKNWLTKLESAKNKMTNLLNTSPLSKTKTTVFYLSSSYVNNIVNYLREEKIIAVIDMEMIDLRFHELKEYAKKYDNKDIDDFLEYMKDNDYISPLSGMEDDIKKPENKFLKKFNDSVLSGKIYNKLIDYVEFVDSDLLDFFYKKIETEILNMKSPRVDNTSHRTLFIKSMWNIDGKAEIFPNKRPYNINIISKLIQIFYTDLDVLNDDAAKAKVKEILKIK
ncbi:hypothetical protein P3S51_05285 [Acinetobacter sp. ANC 7201]|uniref:hypothetical protein n=1 Tax=Acinetobacter sp. ANC 7201 TaxID=3035288 RepID=UPI0027A92608|nr:hypothetical protein [Acinetobacter sp. ANC 7201]WFP97722.1 hypothetical protein P3S51_05285 [Acinetobacter sp. ANC 7201]